MVIKWLEICLLLSKNTSPKKYIELTNIMIHFVVENYNEYLPFNVIIDSEKIRKIIEKINNKNEGQTFRNN